MNLRRAPLDVHTVTRKKLCVVCADGCIHHWKLLSCTLPVYAMTHIMSLLLAFAASCCNNF